MYSVMWSEHCSYKSSKVHLRYFGETTTDEMRAAMLAGIGENAGVVDIGDGWAVTFKVESHNHPSYVEPYQGAATGVGGIVRDIMAMGARPVAVMDQLRFGAADAPDTRRVVDGVVRGVGGYGNSLGLPNIGGETVFDASYAGNPLVNALCVGRAAQRGPAPGVRVGHRQQDHPVRRAHRPRRHRRRVRAGVGDVRRRRGGAPGRKKLPSVQVGDPFTEKVLIECCLELYAAGLVVGIQDLGGAGLSCATSELASAGDGGMRDRAGHGAAARGGHDPGRDPVQRIAGTHVRGRHPGERRRVHGGVPQVGGAGHRHRRGHRRRPAADHLARRDRRRRAAAHGRPRGPGLRAAGAAARHPGRARTPTPPPTLPRPATGDELRATLLALLGSPHLCSRAFITEQYDRYVRGNTVLAEHADGGVLRIDEATGRGIAMSTDASGRYTQLDPYTGAQLALAEAYRNVAVTGATPDRGDQLPELRLARGPRRDVAVQQAVRGLADGCAALGIPVTGGNVSFYNQTGTTAILPTPVVGVLGVIDDVRRRIPTGLGTEPGETLILLGDTRDEFDGSIWAQVTADHLGGAAAEGRPGAREAARRGAHRRVARRAGVGRARPVRGRAGPGGRRGCAGRRNRLPHRASRGCRPVRHAVLRVGGPRAGRRAAHRGEPVHRDVRGPRAARRPASASWTRAATRVEVQGQFTVSLEELRSTSEGVLPGLFG